MAAPMPIVGDGFVAGYRDGDLPWPPRYLRAEPLKHAAGCKGEGRPVWGDGSGARRGADRGAISAERCGGRAMDRDLPTARVRPTPSPMATTPPAVSNKRIVGGAHDIDAGDQGIDRSEYFHAATTGVTSDEPARPQGPPDGHGRHRCELVGCSGEAAGAFVAPPSPLVGFGEDVVKVCAGHHPRRGGGQEQVDNERDARSGNQGRADRYFAG
jgi:hypothetical protein